MQSTVYCYEFGHEVPMEEVEASIVLALLAAESLHGQCEVQLAAPHYLDLNLRTCIVDATTPAGNSFNRVLLGFLRREFGPESFRVRRVGSAEAAEAAPAA